MRRLICLSFLLLLIATWSDVCSAELVLVRDGQPSASIVIAASPTENAKAGAKELQHYIEKISGATLSISSDAAPPDGTLILVGRSALTDKIADLKIPSGRTKKFQEEGFVIRTTSDRLVLAGNDAELYRGTRYAVVELLHRLGVRWFMPGEMGEVVPKMATITVPSIDVTERPDFPMRGFWEYGRDNMAAEQREWMIHNKMNEDAVKAFGLPSDSSVMNYLPGKDHFAAHPDWFALAQDGTRLPGHPCTTSEEMIAYIAEKIKTQARAGSQVSAFAPEDGAPRCWCKRCEKIGNGFDGFGANERDPVTEASASNEWFYFVNRILTEVNKEFPDHILGTNGYANRDIPPELPPEVAFNASKNLAIMFANIGACTLHAYDDPTCWQMKRQGQMVRQFCRVSDKVWMYNYNYTMLVNKGTITPMVHRIRRNIPLLKEWGSIGFLDQDQADWTLTGIPTRLVRARLEWDVKADVDAILDDFYSKWFGGAARPMKKYYEALEEAFEETPQHGHEDIILFAIYTDQLMSKLASLIEAAEASAKTDTEKSHVRIERAMYDHLQMFCAMHKAGMACDFKVAGELADKMVASREAMNKLSPFLGWHPSPLYEVDFESVRMKKLSDMVDGPVGHLVAVLPEEAAFRTDPHDDGRFERWQDTETDISQWKKLKTTDGWESQGFQDAAGHPYKGVAWYIFDIDVPADAKSKAVFLHAPAVVNEAWLWVNGKYAGHRPYMMPWSRPQQMELEVSQLLSPGAKNRIAFRVLCNFDVWGANGIYERMFLYAKK